MTTLSSPQPPPDGPTGHRPRSTMREVAALAGVSLKTVSRVINREPGVSSELVRKVERAATQLDFRPNLTAANLRRAGQRTATIGLVLEDVSNPFFAAILRGVEEVAVQRGVAVFAASLDEDHSQEQQIVEALSSRRVDGLILAPTALEQGYLANEMRSGLAMAFVDRAPRGVDGDVIVSNGLKGGQQGAQPGGGLADGLDHQPVPLFADGHFVPRQPELLRNPDRLAAPIAKQPDPPTLRRIMMGNWVRGICHITSI